MAKVIKGEKQLAIIVDQREYDLLVALVGQTNGSGYNVDLWIELKQYRKYTTPGVISSSVSAIEILNKDADLYG